MPESTSRRGSRALSVAVALFATAALLAASAAVFAVGWRLLGPEGAQLAGRSSVSATSSDHLEDDGYTVWERNDDGLPVRWDPCSPVELVVAMEGAPAGFLEDLRTAVERVREATGLDVVVGGRTDERPSGDRLPYQPERYGERWAPVLVVWSTPDEPGARLRDIDRAVATPVAVGPEGERAYVSGQVIFNRERDDLSPGFDDRAASWGATIMHELGHIVGLGHVDDPDELMAVHPGEGPVSFGPGDLRGLEAVGSQHGCMTTPRPQPVELVEPLG